MVSPMYSKTFNNSIPNSLHSASKASLLLIIKILKKINNSWCFINFNFINVRRHGGYSSRHQGTSTGCVAEKEKGSVCVDQIRHKLLVLP